MTDRELLELAAKAAGISHAGYHEGRGLRLPWYEDADDMDSGWWNPLTDDGDALRLAVKLGIGAQSYAALGYSHAGAESVMRSVVIKEPHNDDPCASTRCAIVRAAATIGASK